MIQHKQESAYDSPWSIRQRIMMMMWNSCWSIFCSWTPKPFNGWRVMWLKMFGARIYGKPFVHQRARIQIPWNLEMHHRSALGDRAHAYSLGKIIIREEATVAQEVYLCTGTHDFSSPAKNLITDTIIVERNVFIGVRAIVLPGVTIGENSIVGAGSIVTKNVRPDTVVKGNPAR